MNIKGKKLLICGSGDRGTGYLAQQGVLRYLDSISAYHSAWDLLHNEGELPTGEEDFCEWLKSADDFEALAYFCVSGELVIIADSVNGEVLSFCGLDEFLRRSREQWAAEDFAHTI